MNCSMNAIRETSVPSLAVLAILVALSGCSKRDHDRSDQQVSAAPLVMAAPAEEPTTNAIATDAGGIPTTYMPYFEGGSLLRITEARGSSAQHAGPAEYHYHGARLVRYTGAALQGEGSLHLEFDLQGTLISARKPEGPVAEDEVAAVRRRAQLLRSHALAQRATRMHQEEADSG
jgi:hypothetical protein